ncbi:uncharacterized protein E0L32_004846 [Thyridium curvatum]|uniref:Transglutaminase-like domain-containing protein n=1 Tax=Thyridium curvatum TaxID=1093900 RepID=A0A507B7A7_9PEZI|nr:uncharacterized protein E0L32_004846 [Thyridium curvatum]TPX15016.1 hypothetical protein E0L32_004846 [Thyridium curvatum]
MADVEEPQFTTLAERIAALNKQKNFQSSAPSPAGKRPPPPPPPANRSASQVSRQSTDNPVRPTVALQKSPTVPARPSARDDPPPLPRRTTAPANENESSPPLPSRGLAPPLPSRRSSQQTSPSLPPRRPSSQQIGVRRNSNSSVISHVSTISNVSLNQSSSATSVGSTDGHNTRKLPPPLDQAKLPPLPPTRRELEAKAREAAASEQAVQAARAPLLPTRSSPAVPRVAEPARPSLPPRLPSRPARSAAAAAEPQAEPGPRLPARKLPPRPASFAQPKSVLQLGFNNREKPPAAAELPADDAPPPVPVASRPSLAQINAAGTRSEPAISRENCCLICRDFSGPDNVAAQFPVASLPRQDPVGYLARVLCSSFQSPTDKARAIFTWCHHNIAYDAENFFGGCIPRGQTVEQSMFSGKAVCEGYAKIYQAIAQRAGLECVVVGGHGKGYGFTKLGPNDPLPPRKPTGHAWNAVRVDGGEWKLLDACWGAGNVNDRRFNKVFDPDMFTMSNELFGLKHFPEDSRHFYRADGRVPTWEEYIVEPLKDEPATLYSNARAEGISEWTMAPREKHIPVRGGRGGEVVRFQISKLCEHWTYEKHGGGRKPYLMMLKIHGLDGRKEDLVPMEHDGGFWWWADIPARDLGAPGQTVSLYGLDTLDGRDARGVSKRLFLQKKGTCGMSWVGIAAWELV